MSGFGLTLARACARMGSEEASTGQVSVLELHTCYRGPEEVLVPPHGAALRLEGQAP